MELYCTNEESLWLTAHVTDDPNTATGILDEENSSCNHSTHNMFPLEALSNRTLGLVIVVQARQRLVDLGHVAIDIVIRAM